MNVRRIAAASRVILAAQKNGVGLAATLAMALESEQLLQFPEAVAEHAALQARLAELEKDTTAKTEATSTPLTLGRAQAFAEAAAAVDELSMTVEQAIRLREVGPLTALQDAADLLRRLAGATEPRSVLTYRASHGVIELSRYTTAGEAQRHCEAFASREFPGTVTFDWLADEEDEDLAVAELVVQTADGEEVETGYTVTPLEVATAYDPDADE